VSLRKTYQKAWGYLWRCHAPFDAFLPEIGQDDLALLHSIRPFTMTTPERMYALLSAVRYVCANSIPGDIVECGVWRGGSMMLVAKTLIQLGQHDRNLHLYDTFAGMTAPSAKDRTRFEKQSPVESFAQTKKDGDVVHWSYAALEEVRKNMFSTGYNRDRLHFIKGPVEDTIPGHMPERIALLRLDTDFYESSKHEMLHLFPQLVQGGVLVLDDYGHWEGQRLAVEEYFAEHKVKMLLNRIDYTGRIGVKT
jgi:O-methyltransferase